MFRRHRQRRTLLIGIILLAAIPGCDINSVVLFPDRDVQASPEQFGLSYQPIRATNAAGRQIHGWLILPGPGVPPQVTSPKATVLISHGNAGNVGSFLPWAKMLAEAGYVAALYDYQGYGTSEGPADVTSLVGDGAAVVRWLREHGYVGSGAETGAEDGPAHRGRALGLLGLSLGTLVSTRLASQVPEVAAVVLEGSLIPGDELKRKFGTLGAPVAWMLARQIPDELDTGQQIQLVRCPVLFLHTTADETTSVEGARDLFARANQPKQWIEVPDLAHLALLFDWPDYAATVVGWFDKHLAGKPIQAP